MYNQAIVLFHINKIIFIWYYVPIILFMVYIIMIIKF